VLAIVSEVYDRNTHAGADLSEGRRRLAAKVARINAVADPEFRIADYGTRRRFSRACTRKSCARWPQDRAQVVGTSNVKFAQQLGLTPLGTMAHEYLQACQAVGPRLRDSQVFAFNTGRASTAATSDRAVDVCGHGRLPPRLRSVFLQAVRRRCGTTRATRSNGARS